MPIPDNFTLFDSDVQKAVSAATSEIPKYDPTLFDQNSKIQSGALVFIERVNIVAMANTGLLIIPYETIEDGMYSNRINVVDTADLISIFNISSTTPKKFIKVIQTGDNDKKPTQISLANSSLQTFKFKRNGVNIGQLGYSTSIMVAFNELISGFLVYLENGKFVFDFQIFVYRDGLFSP
jgi:hypothetical protein